MHAYGYLRVWIDSDTVAMLSTVIAVPCQARYSSFSRRCVHFQSSYQEQNWLVVWFILFLWSFGQTNDTFGFKDSLGCIVYIYIYVFFKALKAPTRKNFSKTSVWDSCWNWWKINHFLGPRTGVSLCSRRMNKTTSRCYLVDFRLLRLLSQDFSTIPKSQGPAFKFTPSDNAVLEAIALLGWSANRAWSRASLAMRSMSAVRGRALSLMLSKGRFWVRSGAKIVEDKTRG